MKLPPNTTLFFRHSHLFCNPLSLCFAIAAAMNACTLNDSGDPGLCGYALSDDAFGTLECQCAPIEQGNREQPILDHCTKFIPANSVATGCTQNHICVYECSTGYVFATNTAKCVPENADQCKSEIICKGNDRYRCSDNTLIETCQFGCDTETGACLSEVCSANETKCTGDTEKSVCIDNEWKKEACPENQICRKGECIEQVCPKDVLRCNDRIIQKCVDNAWTNERTCEFGCLNGECTENPCSTEYICKGKNSYICSTNTLSEICEYACDSDTGKCLSASCSGSETKCLDDGKTKAVCKSDRWQNEACGEDNICLNSECVPLVCEKNEKQCSKDGIPQKCQNNTWMNTQDTACEHACKDGQCITCADDGTCRYLTVSPAYLDILEGHTDSFTISYVIDNNPQTGKKLNLTASNKDCIEVPATITTGAEPVSVQVKAKAVTAACTSDITISDALGVAQNVTISISVHLKADTNHNYMIDDFDLKDGKDCRYYADCDSAKGSGDGFCDSFIGFKCSNKCTSDDQCISDDYFCRPDGRCAPKVFETVWQTTRTDEEIVFPLQNASECKISVDWGDKSNSSVTTCVNDLPHKYAAVGQHHIKVTGTLDGWSMAGSKVLMEIISFGPVGLGRAAFAQSGLKKISSNDIPDATKLTTMNSMFMSVSNNNSEFHIENWDTSNVTNMSYMFQGSAAFNQNIGKWDTSKVTDMSYMFMGATKFNQKIGKWDTSKVTDMENMFAQTTAFNQDIGEWNTSKVTDMKNMFRQATAFNQNISEWDTSKVTDMNGMFQRTAAFNQNIGKWNTSNVTEMKSMFKEAAAFNQNIGEWDTSKVTNMDKMFSQAAAFNQNIGEWDTSKVTSMYDMFQGATNFNQLLTSWELKKIGSLGLFNIFESSGMTKETYCTILNEGDPKWKEQKDNLGLDYTCE